MTTPSDSKINDQQRAPGLPPELSRAVLIGAFSSTVLLVAAFFFAPGLARTVGRPAFAEGLLIASLALCAVLSLIMAAQHRALAAARHGEASFRELYENITEGVFRSTLDGRMISANPSLVRLNGYETEEQLVGCCNDIAAEWYVDPGRRAVIHEMLLRTGKVTGVISEVFRHRTRERIWIEENVRLVRDKKSGEPLYYDGTVREVTETVRRLELEEKHNKIASIVSGCLYQHRLTPDGLASMPYASVGLFHIFGVPPSGVAEDVSVLADLIHPDDLAPISASLAHSKETLTPWQCEYRVQRPDGKQIWVFAHAMPERESDGSTLWHGFLTDISERKRSEQRIHQLAYFDPLTGLPNRTMLRDRLGHLMASGEASEWGALLFIDLDQFKILNDSKGHHVGDRLLCEVAERLQGCLRGGDLVARLGGDEFVVMLQELGPDQAGAESRVDVVGRAILAEVERTFLVDGNPFRITASLGAELFRGEQEGGVDDILKRADLAMYEAKAAGRGELRFFAPEMQAAVEDRLALTSDLRDAVAEGGLALAYQAQTDGTGRTFGAEALLRWSHPARGAIPPDEIIPLAECNGLIDPLENWVMGTAFTTLATWRGDPVTRDLRLGVNMTAHQLNRDDFVERVKRKLEATGADPNRVTFELTEHVMLDDIEQVSAVMLQLQALGISFALDDFGTGYSSLSYLKRLPIDVLKIDRSFVRDIEDDPSDREIVQTIINIAQSLNISTIAEGVETEMQALLLRQMGCHSYQGYLFGRPQPLETFVAGLAAAPEARMSPAALAS